MYTNTDPLQYLVNSYLGATRAFDNTWRPIIDYLLYMYHSLFSSISQVTHPKIDFCGCDNIVFDIILL